MTLDGAISLKCVNYFGNSISVPHASYCKLSLREKENIKGKRKKRKKKSREITKQGI